ncbi:MAG TPA: OmpA family protein [Chitinophagaceae bacterium]|nr:OmpA family protein [Chitinophagaceae bacterium]
MNTVLPIQKKLRRSLLVMMIVISGKQASSQADQRIAMADKYFDAGEYYTAAGLYEQILKPPKKEIPRANFPLNNRRYNQAGTTNTVNKLDILYKQAESYRLANYWTDAAAKYKECFEKDFTKYTDAFYWYAVCQRSLGNYAATEEYLNRFLRISMVDNSLKQDAEKELKTVQFIKEQLTRPDTILFTVKKTQTSFSHEKGIFALNHISGNNFLFTSTATDAVTTNGVNPHRSRLFSGTLNNNVLEHIESMTIEGADVKLSQGAACLNADKNILYFTQWKKENGNNVSSIYYSKKEEKGWSKPELLTSINRPGYNSKQPFCSADGKTLYFASDMPGGSGDFDIWSAPINEDGSTADPLNAGNTINTIGEEQAPFYHSASGHLVFASNGRQGMGGFDLFTSKVNGSLWGESKNMGHPVNSSRDDIYFFAPGQRELLKNAIIGSDRGSECCLETYSIVKQPKNKEITGIVRDCNDSEPLANVMVVMKDISGKKMQATTGSDGKFLFELTGDISSQTFNVVKEGYKERTTLGATESVDETDLMTDLYINVPICINKIEKPVEPKLEIKAENVVSVYFDFDKSLLTGRSKEVLDSIYNILMEEKNITIQISGYTDGLGTDEYNRKLSDRRGKACADYLRKKGLEASRISFISFGECCPVEMELIDGRDNPDGRSRNRRALINIARE